jgi:predicted negative regulator of RcsB-dependent stress response
MATHLDLEEQEQLDQLKAFWKQYGNLISWLLVLVLAAFAAWNGWNLYQRDQGAKAGALFDELEHAAQHVDSERATRIFSDMRDRYPRTTVTQQGGLLAARVAAEKGQYDAAKASLAWVADNAGEAEYRAIAPPAPRRLVARHRQVRRGPEQLDAIDSPAVRRARR